jgi:chitin disaccharide deacetylase
MIKLIINCDDFGVSEETNLGIIDCLLMKKATSASIIANGEFFDHALKNIKEKAPNNLFGIHLNLTEGTALNSNSIKALTNKDLKFNINASEFFLMNFNRKKEIIDNLIYLEFKAQILKVKKAGIRISHFDSHEHIHHSPFIYRIIKKLGNEFGINKIRLVKESIILRNLFKDFGYKFMSKNYVKLFLLNYFSNRIRDSFFLSPNYFYGILNSGKIEIDEFFLYLSKIKQDNVIELCIHPANEISFPKIEKNKTIYKKFIYSQNRLYEKKLLFSKEFENNLKDQRIKLIDYSGLKVK